MSLLNDLIDQLHEYKDAHGKDVHYIILGKGTYQGILSEIHHDPIEVARFTGLPIIILDRVDIYMQVGEFENHKEKKSEGLRCIKR